MINFDFGTKLDDIFYAGYAGEINVIFGRAGNDIISESSDFQSISDDFYFGGKGNDTITSQSGNDFISAGAGDDVVNIYGDDMIIVRGGRGYDIAYIHVTDDAGHHPDMAAMIAVERDLKGFEEIVYL